MRLLIAHVDVSAIWRVAETIVPVSTEAMREMQTMQQCSFLMVAAQNPPLQRTGYAGYAVLRAARHVEARLLSGNRAKRTNEQSESEA